MNARDVALAVVRDVFPANGPVRGAQEALDYHLRKSELDERDAALAATLAYGAIKMRRTIDWYLEPYLSDRRKGLPPAIAEILRLGMYELRFLRSAPHAVVSQWVGLAKHFGHTGTAGLVNAVLRRFLRDDPPVPSRERFANDADFLAVRYSFPTWLVRQWRASFGDARLEAILQACNDPAQPCVAVNRRKFERAQAARWFAQRGVEARESLLAEDAVLLEHGGAVRRLQEEAHGSWWAQSESSAMVVDVLNPQRGEAILDACSGRGNKALQIAARLDDDRPALCVDRDARKIAALERRAREADLRVATVLGDARDALDKQRFDRILIDAPCSGIGVAGRHPEMRWRKRLDDGERLAVLQNALLEALAQRLYDGGALVYAVCSTDSRETTEVVEAFLRSRSFRRGLIPERYTSFETDEGDVLIPPGLEGRDGFFMARLELL